MTWTVTERGFDTQSAASADLTSDTFTPAAEVLLVALVIHNEGDGSVNGVSGHGTWIRVFIGVDQGPNSNSEFELWATISGSSPSSATIAIDVDYQNKVSAEFFEIDETSGFSATVANNFGTPAYDNGTGSNETLTATVAAFAASDNMAFGWAIIRGGTAGSQWAAEGGYTEQTENQGNDYNTMGFWLGSEDTTISATHNESTVASGLVGVEIKHEAAGGGATPNLLSLLGVG